MNPSRLFLSLVVACVAFFTAFSQSTFANTLCVNPSGHKGCFTKIQDAVNFASNYDIIQVAPGTYNEQVTIGKPLSLLGAGPGATTIDASNLAHGIFVDGLDYPGVHDVIIAGFTIENAQYEGVLLLTASDVIVRDNHVINNDKDPGLEFTGAPVGCPDQPGSGTYEHDETGDCGGAIHLIGTVHLILSGNLITGNADGVLISDETAESRDNLLIHNTLKDNPLECGIVLASHPPSGSSAPFFAAHYGVNHNTVAENVSTGNGVQIGGSGVGLFSDGNGPGTVTGNVIIDNELIGNGLGGVALHTHVGPAFGAPADNMDGNMIIGNHIARNLADTDDTATPGTVGININSGGGGSPVRGTIISQNVIRDEDVDIAVNTPANVDVHLNDLLGGKIGVANICAFDNPNNPSVCTGSVDATENFFGCPGGPGDKGCSNTSGPDILVTPWLDHSAVPSGDDDHHQD
ncbi:MAG: right-handed parallel beta-helix repeat-containing protein [Candidatus Acidiferrales bacterium]